MDTITSRAGRRRSTRGLFVPEDVFDPENVPPPANELEALSARAQKAFSTKLSNAAEMPKKTNSPAPRGHYRASSRQRGSQRASKGFSEVPSPVVPPTARNLFSGLEGQHTTKPTGSPSPSFPRLSTRLFGLDAPEDNNPAATPFKFKVTVNQTRREIVPQLESLLSTPRPDYIAVVPERPLIAPLDFSSAIHKPLAPGSASRKRETAEVDQSPAKRRRISIGSKSARKQVITTLPPPNFDAPDTSRSLISADDVFTAPNSPRSRAGSAVETVAIPATPNNNLAVELTPVGSNLTVPSSMECETPLAMHEILAWVIFGQDDYNVTRNFIFAYIHFKLTPKELFKFIWNYYHQPPLQYWKVMSTFAQQRARVINFVTSWIQLNNSDFDLVAPAVQTPGIPVPKDKANRVPLKFYLKFLEVLKADGISGQDLGFDPTPQTPPQCPISPRSSTASSKKSMGRRSSSSKSLSANTFAQFDTDTFATQLTINEFKLLKSVPLTELVGQAWNKADSANQAPRLTNIIKHFNRVSYWVGQEIAAGETAKEQGKCIDRFISVGKRLKDLGNFNGLMEIYSGLMANAVQRLTDAWKTVPSRQMTRLKKFEAIMNPYQNAGAYRARLADCQRMPVIPYFGVHLGDIVHLVEGIEDEVPDKYQFHKVNKLGELLADWHKWTQQTCDYQEAANIFSYLQTLRTVNPPSE